MKKYRLLVTCIIAMGIIIIGTSNPVSNFYKTTNLISSGKITNEKADKDENSNKKIKIKMKTNLILKVIKISHQRTNRQIIKMKFKKIKNF
ncbi:hypothetical protein SIL21_07190 [Clostridioides difficile]|uniref:hypothetical protein n=1 Tax=Clostridioides difficile TaxID=1496 RepID=UPI0029C4713F|nr:hypothetical protein [Clostridioides difficile]MDX5735325.1 hypothetical protein [Clostridioides difficile]